MNIYFPLIIPDSYDVNVSPDKRTILLHEQNALLDALRVRPLARIARLTDNDRALLLSFSRSKIRLYHNPRDLYKICRHLNDLM